MEAEYGMWPAAPMRAAQNYFGYAKITGATGAIAFEVQPNILDGVVRNGAGSYTLTMLSALDDPGIFDDVNAAPFLQCSTVNTFGVVFRSGVDTWEVRTYADTGAATDADFAFHWLQDR